MAAATPWRAAPVPPDPGMTIRRLPGLSWITITPGYRIYTI